MGIYCYWKKCKIVYLEDILEIAQLNLMESKLLSPFTNCVFVIMN